MTSTLENRNVTMPHAVQFYEDDVFLLDAVCAFVKAGYEANATPIVVATEKHRDDLRKTLQEWGNPDLIRKVMQFDAAELLSGFMVEDWPNQAKFNSTVGRMVEEAARRGPVHIYGEMVAVLWAEGKTRAAIRLEELWNELATRHAFSLLCGYPISAFPSQDTNDSFHQVCHTHPYVHTPA